MDSLLDNFARLGRYLVAVILIWLGLVGLADVGFTAIDTLPLIDAGYAKQVVFTFQIVIGIGIFNSAVKRFAKPVALIYFLLLAYGLYLNYPQLFEPAIPYLTNLGQSYFLEVLLIFAGNSYLRHYK